MKKKPKIIHADDHKGYRTAIRTLLEDSNFQVIAEANDGEQLLQILRNESVVPDLILLDIEMPVMNGIKALKLIKEEFPSYPVILLSMEKDWGEFLPNYGGADAFICKEVDENILLSTITNLLGKKALKNLEKQ